MRPVKVKSVIDYYVYALQVNYSVFFFYLVLAPPHTPHNTLRDKCNILLLAFFHNKLPVCNEPYLIIFVFNFSWDEYLSLIAIIERLCRPYFIQKGVCDFLH